MLESCAATSHLRIFAVLGGSSVDDVDLRSKECPCTDGYVCDTSTWTCAPYVTHGGGGRPRVPAVAAAALARLCHETKKVCVKFCCSNADCVGLGGNTTCTPINAAIGALGACE